VLGIALSFIGGALIIALAFWFVSNLATALANPLFDISLVVGLVICAGAALFYLRPRSHSAWGIIVLIASLADLMGSFYFLLTRQLNCQLFHTIRKRWSHSRISGKRCWYQLEATSSNSNPATAF